MKDYNRLIQRDVVGAWSVITPELIAELRKIEETKVSQNTATQLIDIIANRLAELEDKIEKGTLKFMPCKVGDTVYRVVRDYDWEGSMFWRVDNWKFTYECLDYWGYTVFPTKPEAEAKLRELQGEGK